MLCEQFLVYFMPKNGYRILRSPRVQQVLSEKNWQKLLQLGGGIKQDAILTTPLCEDHILAVSYIAFPQVQDEYLRRMGLNHTFLLPCIPAVKALKLSEKFQPYFIKSPEAVPQTLQTVDLVI